MRDMEIQHSFGYSVRKSSYIERFNRTIQDLIAREASAHGSDIALRWVDFVDRALFKYNYINIHSFIKMTPAQAERPMSQKKLKQLFEAKHAKVRKKNPKLKIGDQVRIWRNKGRFGRSYTHDFSQEIFTVHQVFTNMPHPRYELIDGHGNVIMGNWLEEELSQFIPPNV